MSTSPKMQFDSRWPQRVAWLLAACTFPLIWVGGLVTTYDAGMAVPDWPGTYGYNLLLYPWATWLWGPWDLFIEHGHRLLGALAGLLAIAFNVSVFATHQPRWLRVSAVAALLLVIFQGALGGARVLMDARQLAMIHGCVGPLFFAFTVVLTTLTGRWWREVSPVTSEAGGRLQRLALSTAILAFLQLVLGAQLRHVSVMASHSFFQAFVLFHIVVAFVLVGHAIALFIRTRRLQDSQPMLKRPATILLSLLAFQILLGLGTWVVKYGLPAIIVDTLSIGYIVQAKSLSQSMVVTMHVATGSLILAMSVLTTVRAFRCLRRPTVAPGVSAAALAVGVIS